MTESRFALHPTPVGDVVIVTTGERITALHPARASLDETFARMGIRENATPVEKSGRAANIAKRQLDEYFAGTRREFSLPLEWDRLHGFTRLALEAVCTIPYGETAGYGEVAAMAGSPRAARAVGTACATTPFSIVVPVHRVVRADGSLGEYGGRPELKARLLGLEEEVIAPRDGATPG